MSHPVHCLNGTLVRTSEAQIPADDEAFLLGLGLFETLVAYESKLFAWQEHYDRLLIGADVLGLKIPGMEEISEELNQTLAANRFTSRRQRLRITLSPQTRLVSASDCPDPPEALTATINRHPVNDAALLAGAKSTSYAEYHLALQSAKESGFDEAILFNTRGQLCEGSTSNLFYLRNGCIHTPALETGCLPGVTRRLVIAALRDEGIEVQESTLPLGEVLDAEEAFLTSTIKEVCPLTRIDKTPLKPGPFTQKVRSLYQKLLP